MDAFIKKNELNYFYRTHASAYLKQNPITVIGNDVYR